ncbi:MULTISPECIES: hypothetical protein [Mycobacterium]|uniref:hypothetical protein n=1 Tax=Mycobacterium TaxID=1763 RepID=UPI001EF04E8E|nr:MULTISPECIES: hypothetical protein [Mycobacterium]BDB42957.1 hypothetical protein IWGMT90018_34030 [Mycobacterium kiyosense]BDE13817.1 hypothetical protein MKCMC460_26770 [Mycobacterium sp. 20KCMC460]GLB90815.1 hypothetical protein SRL2020130_36320 [Mycobacterium kiyosense]GLC00863.1 hypothetical protein SRL2020400_14540 [Mycobacterium kiyosense]GLC08057.1 hypothetical protein SRL2020411_27030 [Mycobacterium kiyosense]
MSLHVLSALGAEGPSPQSMPTLPTAREFLTSAGFGGVAAVIAAVILALVAYVVARRTAKRDELQIELQERHRQERREDEQRAAAIDRCWQRLVWVVETAGLEPAANEHATLGLGPELALELLRGLLRDAEQLGDETLAKSVSVYLNQFSLVLAQQAGPLSQFASAQRKEAPREAPAGRQSPPNRESQPGRDAQPTRESPPGRDAPQTREPRHEQPTAATQPASADEQPTETVAAEPAAEGRRRRR